MAGSHKEKNRWPLFSTLLLNGAILYGLVTTGRVEPSGWLTALGHIQTTVPAALGLALIAILNSQLSAKAKERIVFWEWNHPLPGCRAFSKFLPSDDRINVQTLEARFGPFPELPAEQNRVWYGIYRKVQGEPAIESASRAYLFARDYAALVLLMVPVLGTIAIEQLASHFASTSYIAFLLLQVALAINAARRNGERLVTSTMAIASTK